jgi:hypothetical protein
MDFRGYYETSAVVPNAEKKFATGLLQNNPDRTGISGMIS